MNTWGVGLWQRAQLKTQGKIDGKVETFYRLLKRKCKTN